jgi:hypothetical protein
MRAKISMMPVNMTGYPAVRKTAHHAPVLAELEFAMHRQLDEHLLLLLYAIPKQATIFRVEVDGESVATDVRERLSIVCSILDSRSASAPLRRPPNAWKMLRSYNSLQSPATLNEIDDDNHDGNDQENVNEPAKRVRGHQSEQPKNN